MIALLSTTTVNTLSEFANQILQFSSLPDLPVLYQSNQSATSLDSPLEVGFGVYCNGSHFGHNLNLQDCLDAEDYVIPDTRQQIFAERGTEIGRDYYPLPYRVMGRECQNLDGTL